MEGWGRQYLQCDLVVGASIVAIDALDVYQEQAQPLTSCFALYREDAAQLGSADDDPGRRQDPVGIRGDTNATSP